MVPMLKMFGWYAVLTAGSLAVFLVMLGVAAAGLVNFASWAVWVPIAIVFAFVGAGFARVFLVGLDLVYRAAGLLRRRAAR